MVGPPATGRPHGGPGWPTTKASYAAHAVKTMGQPFHEGTETGAFSNPGVGVMGRWARRGNRICTWSAVTAMGAGISMRSRQIIPTTLLYGAISEAGERKVWARQGPVGIRRFCGARNGLSWEVGGSWDA